MPLGTILRWIRHQPIKPFRLHVTDGSSYHVLSPDLIMPGVLSVVIGIPALALPEGVYERTALVAPMNITHIEPVPRR
jgi:hypothetical protein